MLPEIQWWRSDFSNQRTVPSLGTWLSWWIFHVPQNDVVKTRGAANKTVCTGFDRVNLVLLYRLKDRESAFHYLYILCSGLEVQLRYCVGSWSTEGGDVWVRIELLEHEDDLMCSHRSLRVQTYPWEWSNSIIFSRLCLRCFSIKKKTLITMTINLRNRNVGPLFLNLVWTPACALIRCFSELCVWAGTLRGDDNALDKSVHEHRRLSPVLYIAIEYFAQSICGGQFSESVHDKVIWLSSQSIVRNVVTG